MSFPLARRVAAFAVGLQFAAPLIATLPAQIVTLPSETPARLTPTYDGFDHMRPDVMIPMRDGIKLHTVILVPKKAKHTPILPAGTRL